MLPKEAINKPVGYHWKAMHETKDSANEEGENMQTLTTITDTTQYAVTKIGENEMEVTGNTSLATITALKDEGTVNKNYEGMDSASIAIMKGVENMSTQKKIASKTMVGVYNVSTGILKRAEIIIKENGGEMIMASGDSETKIMIKVQ